MLSITFYVIESHFPDLVHETHLQNYTTYHDGLKCYQKIKEKWMGLGK